MAVERFEDILAWKKARALAKAVYQVTATGQFARDFGLRDQIRRASVSAVSNIAEGFERDGNREFLHFLSVAKGSTGEVRSQLYVALDAELVTQEQFEHLYRLATDTSRLIAGFMRSLRESEYRGNRFQPPSGIAETAVTWNLELGIWNSDRTWNSEGENGTRDHV